MFVDCKPPRPRLWFSKYFQTLPRNLFVRREKFAMGKSNKTCDPQNFNFKNFETPKLCLRNSSSPTKKLESWPTRIVKFENIWKLAEEIFCSLTKFVKESLKILKSWPRKSSVLRRKFVKEKFENFEKVTEEIFCPTKNLKVWLWKVWFLSEFCQKVSWASVKFRKISNIFRSGGKSFQFSEKVLWRKKLEVFQIFFSSSNLKSLWRENL